ncbi:hypothetical protein DPEC_G00078690 [Dallia pectoralis]|uniref:Uncharacterized protein n=1 Tax=Dallia pectoralis TaxID=75939 RepID=A0ACC2H465_DALPE|nr:hypothetical protein DPEC_G00078690 [Dallia pectoralis]
MVILLLHVRLTDGGDFQVTCGFSEECVLPCSFQPGREEIIHWVKQEHLPPYLHSNYYSTDQLEHQDQQYKQRTALFNNQIPKGNASLLLRNITVQDQGRYKCYTSTNKGIQESFINIIVEAPVRLVDIQISNDIITCSSTGIYPKPKLTWSTDPPSDLSPDPQTSQNSTSTKVNSQGLYDIISTKPFNRNQTNICTVTSGTREKTATLKQQIYSSPGSEVSIPCSVPLSDLLTFNLTWRFNQSVNILTYNMDTHQMRVEDHWKEQVQDVSESGSLQLHGLTSEHQGIYSCELSTTRDTHLVLTYLISDEKTTGNINETSAGTIAAIVIGVIVAAVIVAVAVAVCIHKRKKRRTNKESDKSDNGTKEGNLPKDEKSQTASNPDEEHELVNGQNEDPSGDAE